MAREFALFVLESAYKTPVTVAAGTVWSQSGAGAASAGNVIPVNGTPSSTGFSAFYARLDQGDSLTVRARPVMVTVPYGGGFNIPAITVSDKFAVKGRYTTKLYAGPFTQFLFQWASQVVNTGGYVGGNGVSLGWQYAGASGNLPSVTILHAIQRPSDGSYKCQQYSGVKVDSWTLTGSEDSQIMTLTMQFTGGTAMGNPFDGSLDPTITTTTLGAPPVWGSGLTATAWAPPATANLPINPFLFVNTSAEQTAAGSGAIPGTVTVSASTTSPPYQVTAIALGTAGTGYTLPPLVTVIPTGGVGSGATAIAILGASGAVASYQITSGGSGYSTGATATASAVPASGLYIGSERTAFQEFSLTSTNNTMSRFWANRFVQFIEFCGRTTKLSVRNFYQPTSGSPDDRQSMEALATQTAYFGFNNGLHSALFTMNTNNIIESVEDSLPLADIYTQLLTITSQFDPNYIQTDAYLPADMQLTFS